jgi:heat shock protein HslJ
MTNAGAAADPGEGPQRLMVMNGLFRRQGVVWPMRHRAWFPELADACILLMSLALAACGTATSARPVSPGYTGYVWQVVAISHGGKATSIPARLQVALRFSPGGQFGANDSINFHSGTYRTTGDGFTTSALSSTLVGYAGHDPAVLLAISAIGSFGNSVHATVKLTAGQLVVGVGSYTLTCQRRGPQANVPTPAGTGG